MKVKILFDYNSLCLSLDKEKLAVKTIIEKISNSKSRTVCYNEIQKLSLIISNNISKEGNVILAPVMRSGLSMWHIFNTVFLNPESSFPYSSKIKGTNNIKVFWKDKNNFSNKRIIILDVISATGDTLLNMINYIEDCDNSKSYIIDIVCCYVSPDALNRIKDRTKNSNTVRSFTIGVLSTGVDNHGYIVPYTNGDLGDKLFTC